MRCYYCGGTDHADHACTEKPPTRCHFHDDRKSVTVTTAANGHLAPLCWECFEAAKAAACRACRHVHTEDECKVSGCPCHRFVPVPQFDDEAEQARQDAIGRFIHEHRYCNRVPGVSMGALFRRDVPRQTAHCPEHLAECEGPAYAWLNRGVSLTRAALLIRRGVETGAL